MLQLKILDSISEAGADHNEDRFGHTHQVAYVIDGATPVAQTQPIRPPLSDAAWLAQTTQALLASQCFNGHNTSAILHDTLAQIVSTTQAHFPGVQGPTATLLLTALNASTLEFFVLGDGCLLLEHNGRSIFHENLNSTSDAIELAAAQQDFALGAQFNEKGSLVGDAAFDKRMQERRATHNSPNQTIWTLGSSAQALEHMRTLQIPVAAGVKGILMTDGFSRYFDLFHACARSEFIGLVAQHGLSALLKKIRHIEATQDPDGVLFPRYKRQDDATAIFFEITTHIQSTT